jgi:hypothetical protein
MKSVKEIVAAVQALTKEKKQELYSLLGLGGTASTQGDEEPGDDTEPSTVQPDANGKCPEGYYKDGDVCKKDV